ARLGELGYRDPAATLERIRRLRAGTKYRQLPAGSRQRFDMLAPLIVEVAAGFDNPDATLLRVFDLLENICRRASYLALLTEYPQALTLVARLASASPWLASYLTRHPMLLDELLDTDSLYAAPDFSALGTDLERRLQEAGEDVERKMDILRHFKHAQVFHFAAQDIAGVLSLETLSDYLSALADMVLDAVLRHAWPGLRGHHREQPRFAVIGYGKLGGKELGYASDLDLVFLYGDDAPEAGEVYARFGQRISAWLNSLTPAGLLYETDLRLRPDGASGLLVSSFQAFAEYQKTKAWTWEHQALTRARFCAGDRVIGEAFEQLRQEVLRQPRNPEKLREEVIAMRQKMRDGHPNNSGLFDLKHDPGGLVDVEFSVQYLVLAYAAQHPSLVGNVGNIALLHQVAEIGLLPATVANSAADAYRQLRRAQHALRLQEEAKARVASGLYADQRVAVRALWRQIFGG
ncbi:MAG: bifunctional [glutamate--ammonia ligase]-adenylyl-L-tyrosine phosphorylase/[glutamate--ammonia-ligase] adenylyltransferase, partial [Nitrosomonadales bacterium]